MDHQILKELFKEKPGPATKRNLSEEIVRERKVPVSRACKIVSLLRSPFYYHSTKNVQEVIEALQYLALQYLTYGFRKLFARLSSMPFISGVETSEGLEKGRVPEQENKALCHWRLLQ